MEVQSPNKLLAALPHGDYLRLLPQLKTLRLTHNTPLRGCGDSRIYFPGHGMCSIGNVMADGRQIEIAGVGNEGVVGLQGLSDGADGAQAFLQVSDGSAQYMTKRAFERELSYHTALRELIARYSRRFLDSLMRSAACNRMHTLQERCCRWLLSASDRIGKTRFKTTQGFLASALGATPEELAVVMTTLARLGLVRHTARTITIVNSEELRHLACGCYEADTSDNSATVDGPAHPSKAVAGNSLSPKVVQLRPSQSCARCSLAITRPHDSEHECIRAIDLEMRLLIRRADTLRRQRGVLVEQRLKYLRQFLDRIHSAARS
jgi:CRP-like cAMP-binding protein